MPFIDTSYFLAAPVQLAVNGNEDVLIQSIESFEPDYLRAALGQSLYEAFMTGIATPTGVYFTNQFSDQFFKGTIADRWKWIRDGHVFDYGGRRLYWPGLQNVAKRSPLANYVYWHFVESKAGAPSSTGTFTVPKSENVEVVPPRYKTRKAWNEMAEWNDVLYAMITTLTDSDGEALYPEFVWGEVYCNVESRNVYNKIPLY